MSTYANEKYAALRQLVKEMAGQRLPGERELATRLDISRPGLRALLSTLETEGLVRRHQGSGTYAIDQQQAQLHTVALLIDAELKLGDDPFFSLLLERLQVRLQAEGIHCIIERIHEQRPRSLYDGAITIGIEGQAILESLRPDDPPVVGLLVNASILTTAHASIFQLADKEAGAEAAHYLLNRHCREFILVGKHDIPASHERLIGAEEVATQAGGRCTFVSCALNYMAGLRVGRTIELPDRPVGIIAANDWLAVGLQAGLASRQLATPIHIVSFDGLPITADPLLNIASLAVPIETIVTDTIAELRRLRQPVAPVGRTVRYPLHWR